MEDNRKLNIKEIIVCVVEIFIMIFDLIMSLGGFVSGSAFAGVLLLVSAFLVSPFCEKLLRKIPSVKNNLLTRVGIQFVSSAILFFIGVSHIPSRTTQSLETSSTAVETEISKETTSIEEINRVIELEKSTTTTEKIIQTTTEYTANIQTTTTTPYTTTVHTTTTLPQTTTTVTSETKEIITSTTTTTTTAIATTIQSTVTTTTEVATTKPETSIPVTEPLTEPPTEAPTIPVVQQPIPEPKVLHFILNVDTNCVHINEHCSAAEKILPENYATVDIREDELSNYAYVYWACGKCSKQYSNELPKF